MTAPVEVVHSRGRYEVRFAPLASALAALPAACVVVTDVNVRAAWSEALDPWDPVVLPAGESSKCLARFGALLEEFALRRLPRRGTVAAVGGGVVGDLAGFAAAAYMRGVRLVQIPTTLLAQVDSSVGGKVGIDLPQGKNLAGAFHPPAEVWIAPETLGTLDARQWRNGLAEVIKTALIADASLLAPSIALRAGAAHPGVADVVRRCVAIKASVVADDEFETTGRRAILNFGHTIGHAIEHESGFTLLHGEAIAIGMALEADLGELVGATPHGTAAVVRGALADVGLPTALPAGMAPDALVSRMRLDKKADVARLAFSLLTDVGACKLFSDVSETAVREVLVPR